MALETILGLKCQIVSRGHDCIISRTELEDNTDSSYLISCPNNFNLGCKSRIYT